MKKNPEKTSWSGPGRALALLSILGIGFAMGCQVNSAKAEGQVDLFELKPSLVRAPAGDTKGSLAAALKIVVAKGYKWNAEYPFRLTIKEQTKTRLSKDRFSKTDLSIAEDQRSAQIDLGATGTNEADASIRGTVSFSVCDKKVCKVYRNRAVEWRLEADAH